MDGKVDGGWADGQIDGWMGGLTVKCGGKTDRQMKEQ